MRGGVDEKTTSNTTPNGESQSTEPTETQLTTDLPDDINFGGYEFRVIHDVLGWGTYTEEHLDFEEEVGEVLSDAMYKRNRSAEDKYGFVLTEIIDSEVSNKLTNSIMSSDDSYDVGMITYGWARGTDILVDFNEIPYVDFTKPWWNGSVAEQMSINGVLTNALSDFMITHRDGTIAMFFNKQLVEDYGIEDLYQLVREGKWTLDKFMEYSRLVTGDVDGDGVFTDADTYGYSATRGNSYLYLVRSVGKDFVENDENGLPAVKMNDEQFIDRVTKVVNFLNANNVLYCPSFVKNNGGDGDQSIFRVFNEDRALFMSHGIGSSKKLRDMKSDFGVLPAPKYDENQENYINAIDAGKYLVVPKTVTDIDTVGGILEALSYEGYVQVIPSYYETMLKNKFMRDDESIEMLDEYIFPYTKSNGFYSSYYDPLMDQIIKNPESATSLIASKADSIQGEIDKLVKTILENE